MELAQSPNFGKFYSLTIIKSFLLWSFTLTVCLLVIGFPLIVLMATVGALAAIILQSVFPMSAVLLVVVSLLGINILGIVVGAAILTFKGIHPQEVRWLNWLHGDASPVSTSVYAACPLTCNITH
ncbi:MAG: hypothetical protein AB4041_10460 [Microcystaceae cyanobacterium]